MNRSDGRAGLALLVVVLLGGCEDAKAPAKRDARPTPVAKRADAGAPTEPPPWWKRADPCPRPARLVKNDEKRSLRCVREDGTYHGNVVHFFADGTKRVEGSYVDGQRDGIWSQWDRAGELLGTYSVNKGTGVVRDWFDTREPRLEISMKSGRRSGPYLEWHEGRKLRWQRAYEDDLPMGTWQQWSPEGTLLGSLTFKKGSGRFLEWNDDGSIAVKGAYRRGKHDGKWQWFTTEDEDGKSVAVEYRRIYKRGALLSSAVYRDGKLIADESDTVAPTETPTPVETPAATPDAGPSAPPPPPPPPPPPEVPRVTVGAVKISGGLDERRVKKALRGVGLVACYAQALEAEPGLRGRISVTFTVSTTGRLTSMRFAGVTDSSLQGCLVKRVGSMSFPAQQTEATVIASLLLSLAGE